MGMRMAKNHNIPQIKPNYKGEETGSWENAKKLAKDDGVNALRYDKQIETLEKQQYKVNEKKKKLIKEKLMMQIS